MPQIKTFVINLKRSKDRKEYIRKILDPLNIEYEIFEATDGQDLSEKEYQAIRQRGKNIIKKYSWRKLITRNEIGCALSHLRIYQKIVKEKINYTCILEDDFLIKNAENFQYCLMEENLISLQKKKEWDFIYLYCFYSIQKKYYYWDRFFDSPNHLGMKWGGEKIKENLYLKKLAVKSHWGTNAYIINQKAAKTFLADNWPVKKLADVLTSSAEYLGLKQYAICPMPLIHNLKIKTMIQNGENIQDKKPLVSVNNNRFLKKKFNSKSFFIRLIKFPLVFFDLSIILVIFFLRKLGILSSKRMVKRNIYYD